MNAIKAAIAVIIIITVLIVLAAVYIFFIRSRVRKNAVKKEAKQSSPLKFAETEEFVSIDDIRGDARGGVICDRGMSRFTAAVLCQGSDFLTDSTEEKLRKQNGYISFLNARTTPFCFRQSPENVSLEQNIDNCKKRIAEYQEEYGRLLNEYQELKGRWEVIEQEKKQLAADGGKVSYTTAEVALFNQVNRTVDRLNASQRHIDHLNVAMNHARDYTNNGLRYEKTVSMYIFSWERPGGVINSRLSTEELFERAEDELDKISYSVIMQLANAGVNAKRASTQQLIDICYKHTHPHSGNSFGVSELVMQTHHNDDIIISNEVSKANERFEKSLIRAITFGGAKADA